MFGYTLGLRAKALCSIIQLLSCVAACCSLVAFVNIVIKDIIIIASKFEVCMIICSPVMRQYVLQRCEAS